MRARQTLIDRKLKKRYGALVGAILCLGFAGCAAAGDQDLTYSSRPAVYWKGDPGKFCRTSVDVESAGKGVAARLLIQKRTAYSEGTLFVRIENLGTYRLFHGVGPLVDRRVNSSWEPRGFKENGRQLGFPALALQLSKESVGSCVEVPIPPDWPAGKYRVRLAVEHSEPGKITTLYPGGIFEVRR